MLSYLIGTMHAGQNLSSLELLIVIVIALGSFMGGLDASVVNIALPSIAESLNISTVTVSWVLNAYLIVMVSFLLAASRIGDIKGYKVIFLSGFGIFIAGTALCGIAPDIWWLLCARVLQAIGGAITSALGAVMVTTYLPARVRGQALGIIAMFLMLGVAIGPVIGGFLISVFSWRYIFFVNIPVGILGIIVGLYILPHTKPLFPEAKLDIFGILLFFFALSLLITGLTTIEKDNPVRGVALILCSLVCWGLFRMQERRIQYPLINLSLFHNRNYSLQSIGILLSQMGISGVLVIMPFYLEIVRAIPPDTTGIIVLTLPFGMILTAPISGKIADVIGTKKPILVGFALCATAQFLLSTLTADTRVGHIGMYLMLLGAGTGIAFSPLTTALMNESPEADRGATSGLLRVMSNLGSTLGVAAAMFIAILVSGPKISEGASHLIPPSDLVYAFDSAFLFGMLISLTGLCLTLLVHHPGDSGTGHEE